uniref:Secreted protein n=1 Tax=Daphnia magna TaxID=35525 RepID=A0A0P4XHM8_9CRUS
MALFIALVLLLCRAGYTIMQSIPATSRCFRQKIILIVHRIHHLTHTISISFLFFVVLFAVDSRHCCPFINYGSLLRTKPQKKEKKWKSCVSGGEFGAQLK